MLKIDIHTHIIPDSLPNFSKKFGYEGFVNLEKVSKSKANMMLFNENFRTISCNCWNPGVRLKECNDFDVNIQVISPIPIMFSYWANPQDALEVSRFINDFTASVCYKYPKNFIGLGTVPMQSSDYAIRELDRCKNDLNLAGVEIGTNINDENLNNNKFHDFFTACEELSMAVFVHPWQMMGMSKMKKYWLPWLIGMPAETSRAICSMAFGGIFEKFPKLRVAFAHGGGNFFYNLGRIEQGFIQRPDLCAVDNKINPREYVGKFYVDSLVHDPNSFKFLLNELGSEKIALGSDYPFPLGEKNPVSFIDQINNLSNKDKENIFYRTALNWLDLDKKLFV